jgi:hypothetical protein
MGRLSWNWTRNNFEGRHFLFKMYFPHVLPRKTEESQDTSVGIAGKLAEIRTRYFHSTSLKT